MSYCRWGEGSDLYVWFGGKYYCQACPLLPQVTGGAEDDEQEADDYTTSFPTELLHHLREHRAKGHTVPQHAIDRLEKEIAEKWQP